jgi:hypothetical protein
VTWEHAKADPFEHLSLDEFAQLEMKSNFLDRIDALQD